MSMVNPRPQLKPAELQQFRWLLGAVLALVAIWTVYHLSPETVPLLWVCTALILLAIARPFVAAKAAGGLGRWAVPGLLAFFAIDFNVTGDLVGSLIRLNVLLVVLRTIVRRSQREELQLIVLGLFLVVIAGVLTVSLSFAIQMLVFTALALTFLFVINIAEAAGGDREEWTRLSRRNLPRRLLAAADWRLIGLAGLLFVVLVGITGLLFVAIPRFQLQHSVSFLNLSKKRSLSGFSETISFGDVTEIQQDNSVALRVEVSDPAAMPRDPYWRMVALDEYENGTFRVSRFERTAMARRTVMLAGVRGAGRWQPQALEGATWTFYLEPGISRFLPLGGSFQFISFRDPQLLQASWRLHLFALRDDPPGMLAYRVQGMDLSGRLIEPEGARAGWTRAREGDAQSAEAIGSLTYASLLMSTPAGAENQRVLNQAVAEITGGEALSASEFAQRASAYLRARHGYSLSISLPPGSADPVVRWLRSGLAGHCELFAGAFTLLARSAGFPTRVVTGFRGGYWNAYENYLMVRNANAHAWCEIYDADGAWLRVDPTPGGASQGAAAGPYDFSGTDRSWAAYVDSLRIIWYRRIVSFDQRAQREMLDAAKTALRESGDAFGEFWRELQARTAAWTQGPWHAGRLLSWAAGAGAILVALRLWRRSGWRWKLALRRGGSRDPVRMEAGRWLRRLEGTGEGADLRREAAWQGLERLRYGAAASWPGIPETFRAAAGLWRRRRRPGR